MKKFNFRLAQFHKVKEFEEKMAWNEVVRQESRVQNIETKINEIKNIQKNLREQLSRTGSQGGIQLVHTDLYNESFSALEKKLIGIKKELEDEKKILEKLKIKHIESKKELKTLEKLKEKKLSEFKLKQYKNDEKYTSEVAAQVFNREGTENE